MDRIWNFRRHRLVQRKRPRMALDGVMLFPLEFQLLPFYLFALSLTLFTLTLCHAFLLSLSLNQFTLS